MAKNDKTNANESNAPTSGAPASAALTSYPSNSATYEAVTAAIGAASRATGLNAAQVGTMLKAIADAAGSVPVAIAGNGAVAASDATTDALPEAGGAGYVVSTIGKRKIACDDGETRNGIVGVAIYPDHDVASIDAHEAGGDYLRRLAEKEMGLVAFRQLRFEDGDTFATMDESAQAMPCSVGDFIARERASGGANAAYAVFLDNWAGFRTHLQRTPSTKGLVSMLPPKKEMLKAIRSQPYAEAFFSELEKAGLIVKVATVMADMIDKAQAAAADAGEVSEVEGDADALRGWLAARADLDLRKSADEGAADFGSALDNLEIG